MTPNNEAEESMTPEQIAEEIVKDKNWCPRCGYATLPSICTKCHWVPQRQEESMTPEQIAEQIVTEYLGVTFSRPGDAPEWLRQRIAAGIRKALDDEYSKAHNRFIENLTAFRRSQEEA